MTRPDRVVVPWAPVRPDDNPKFDPTPKCDCRYGAPMGRLTRYRVVDDWDGLVHLVHIPLDRGGYDKGGAYWGLGGRIYAWGINNDAIEYLRANDRNDAKRLIRKTNPNVRFYR